MKDLEQTLIAYVDGELDPAEVQALEQKLARDQTLQARVREYRDDAALLRAACAENFYADGITRLLQPRSEAPSPGHPAALRRQVIWAVAACLAVGAFSFTGGLYWAGSQASEREELLSEIAEYHDVFARETTHLVEMAPDRANEFFAWMAERLNRPISAPDLTAAGLRFAGGRMLVVSAKPVAELIYTRTNGRPVAFCITSGEGKPTEIRFDQRGHLHLASWADGRHIFVVVGELDRPNLRRIAVFAAAQSGS